MSSIIPAPLAGCGVGGLPREVRSATSAQSSSGELRRADGSAARVGVADGAMVAASDLVAGAEGTGLGACSVGSPLGCSVGGSVSGVRE
ncbi:hypothetical protein, partial [Streptomyces europaeiscabiei]|uniref:hypothetical protein n=1 Tax=Streptomyces europaeiscabiei TaxID=146819 RepID=UPI001C1E0B91